MKKISICLLFLLLFTLSSCYAEYDIFKGKVTNEIVNKTIEYKDINVADLQTAITETVTNVDQSVLGVTVKATHTSIINNKTVTSEDSVCSGSGVVYKRIEQKDINGNITSYLYYVVTNHHLLSDLNPSYDHNIYVYLQNQDVEYKTTLIGTDEKVDLALITFESPFLIQPAAFADSDAISKGQFVIAIGNPDGFEYYGSATFGVVSGELRFISEDQDRDGTNDFMATYIQHDAAINPGNSGGGLFTLDGKLVGINKMKIVKTEVDNMGFAIPSNVVKSLLENYLEKGITPQRPKLGITGIDVRNLTPAVITSQNLLDVPKIDEYNGRTPYGIYVSSVSNDSCLKNTDVSVGDIILEFDGIKLTTISVLSGNLNALVDYFIGTSVEVTYYSRSENEVKTINVVLKG